MVQTTTSGLVAALVPFIVLRAGVGAQTYADCTKDLANISDGWCDMDTNTEECGWDGGDCCHCTCLDTPYQTCGDKGFNCLDPEAECRRLSSQFSYDFNLCTELSNQICDGSCNEETNIEQCGWDGGDCCPCTCDESTGNCGNTEYDCQDPGGAECEATTDEPPPSGDTGMTGDPHLVGLRGQKFDFTGQDSGIYNVVKDGPCNVINMRVTALPGTPQITYITGLGMVLCGDEGKTQEHTVEIIVTEPHSLESICLTDDVCLAEGALQVLIDGEEITGPGEYDTGDGVTVAAVNIPGECRPFGFEKYWLAQEKARQAAMGHRSLRNALPMAEWLLRDGHRTNPVECEKYVHGAVTAGSLFNHGSEHSSFQITSPVLSLRLNHGKVHQVAMRDPTDTIDLPDHLAFQMNVGFFKIVLGDNPKGSIGETIRPVLDQDGQPIMHGLDAIRGDEEDYRVECLVCSDFIAGV